MNELVTSLIVLCVIMFVCGAFGGIAWQGRKEMNNVRNPKDWMCSRPAVLTLWVLLIAAVTVIVIMSIKS